MAHSRAMVKNSDNKKAGLRRLFCVCKEITWQRWRQKRLRPGPRQQQERKQREPKQQQAPKPEPRQQRGQRQQREPKQPERLLLFYRKRPGRERRSWMPAEGTFSLLSSKRQSKWGVSPKKFFTVLIEPNRNQNRFAYQVQRISIVGLRVIPVLQFYGSKLPCCKFVTSPESPQEMPVWPAPRPHRNACERRAHAQPSARSRPTAMSRYAHTRRNEAILRFRPVRERPYR